MASSHKQYVPQDDGVQFVERFHHIDRELSELRRAQNDLENKIATRSQIFGFVSWLLCTAAVTFGLYIATNSFLLPISANWQIFIVSLPTTFVVIAGVFHRLFKSV